MDALSLYQKALRNRVVRQVIRPLLPATPRPDLVRLGSDYGGWWIPSGLVGPRSVVYSVGIGGDASFDLALIDRFGCHVWGFDPTPFSVDYVGSRSWPPQWHFEQVGLWTENRIVKFTAPAGKRGGSSSITRPGNRRYAFNAEVQTLPTLMARLGHDRIDLLKMDVEGAEGPILDDLIRLNIRPRVICVEYDQPEAPWKLVRRVRRLTQAGYLLNKVELWNYTFTLIEDEA